MIMLFASSPNHADVRVNLGEAPGAGGGRAVAAGVPGVPVYTNYSKACF